MTSAQYIAAFAACLLLAWPVFKMCAEWFVAWVFSDDHDHPPAQVRGPSFQRAIESLAGIRQRLIATGCFGDDQKRAIDALTLALVDGSDK